jgi:tRNA (guanine37-N1)-methyltransferase
MVHVYCFVPRRDTESEESQAVCDLVSKHLGHLITLESPDLEIWYVRLVSPKKKMFCASFRLPTEVAFWEFEGQTA